MKNLTQQEIENINGGWAPVVAWYAVRMYKAYNNGKNAFKGFNDGFRDEYSR